MSFFDFIGISRTAPQTPDQTFMQPEGSPPPTIDNHRVTDAPLYNQQLASQELALSAQGAPNYYIPINAEIAKSYVISPTNQGQRAAVAQRQTMMFDPRNSPSRSQFLQAYTNAIQVFSYGNTWDSPSGLSSVGRPTRQPSTKAVSPFATLPIPTRMPWDL